MRIGFGALVALLATTGPLACSLLVKTDGLDDGSAADAATRDVQVAEGGAEDGATDASKDGPAPIDLAAACTQAATTPNLVLYYQFEETSGTTVHDCSATKGDGTLLGGNDASKTSVNGKSGKAFTFDGAATCVAAGPAAALAFTGAFTMSAWVSVKEFSTTNSTRAVAGQTSSSAIEGWRFGADLGAVVSLKLGAPSTPFFVVESSIQPVATWRHFATVFTPGANGTIFVDGDLNETSSKNIPAALTPAKVALTVGCVDASNFFSGEIDELRIYDRALTAAEIKQLAQ